MRKPFGPWAREWMAVQSTRGRTAMNRWERLEAHIRPKWEHTPLIAFNWFEVETWARTLTCAHSTTRDTVSLISRILTGAVDAQHLAVNPLYRRHLTGLAPQKAGKRKTDHEGMWAPPDVVLRLDRRMGPVGVHKEVGAFAQYFVRDENGKRRAHRAFEPPKNPQSARDIDVPPFLAELLTQHLSDWPHDYVLTSPEGKMWWRSAWCDKLRKAADGRQPHPNARGAAKVDPWEPIMPGLTIRDLRHTHDTYQAETASVRCRLTSRRGTSTLVSRARTSIRRRRCGGTGLTVCSGCTSGNGEPGVQDHLGELIS
ncbi:hypothetical protein ACQB60_06220 [Actinomycetota bacterium Odt1-20B]